MAVFEYNRSLTETKGFIGRTLTGFSEVLGTAIAWNDARVTRKSLSTLSDHELDDLGLVRGDIEDIAKGTYRR